MSSLILIWLELWQIKTRLDLRPACLGLGLKPLDLIGALALRLSVEVLADILPEVLTDVAAEVVVATEVLADVAADVTTEAVARQEDQVED